MNLKLAILPAIGILLAGCSGFTPAPSATPSATPEPSITLTPTPAFPLPEGKIIFEESASRKFSGTVYGQGETAVILANMTSGGERQWDPFVKAADKRKFTAVTFNYLQPDYSGAVQNISTVLLRLTSSGYKRVICIGASLGVTACGSIARAPEMVGLVMISGPNTGGTLDDVTCPKLFIAAEQDSWAKATRNDFENAAEPKTLIIYTGNGAHGTELFDSSVYRVQFLQALLDFVNQAA
jgi:hypothetical protein